MQGVNGEVVRGEMLLNQKKTVQALEHLTSRKYYQEAVDALILLNNYAEALKIVN